MPTDASIDLITQESIKVLLALVFSVAIAFAVALIVGGLMRRLFQRIEGDGPPSPMCKAAVRAIRLLAFVIALFLVAFPALDVAGVETALGLDGEDLTEWLSRTGFRIALILLLTVAANRLVGALIGQAEREVLASSEMKDLERHKRGQTISRTLRAFLTALIWLTGALMILQSLEINIMPVLTGAGIVGLAVGFGAQTLVKDYIAGFFLLLEDQVRVGDVADLNGIGGFVEQINLRTTVLRDLEGVVHVIPNGEIRTLANRTKDFSFALLDLAIDYDADVDAAIAAMERTAESLRQDPMFSASILEPLEVLGVNDFQGPAVVVRVRLKTVPLQQWAVGRAFRRRVKREFAEAGIRIPHQRFAMARDNTVAAAFPPDSTLPRVEPRQQAGRPTT